MGSGAPSVALSFRSTALLGDRNMACCGMGAVPVGGMVHEPANPTPSKALERTSLRLLVRPPGGPSGYVTPLSATLAVSMNSARTKAIAERLALAFLLIGVIAGTCTTIFPPDKLDPSTQLYFNAKQPITTRLFIRQHNKILVPISGASLLASLLCFWISARK